MGDAKPVIFFSLSLIISSTLIAFFLMSIYGISWLPIAPLTKSDFSYAQNQDFKSNQINTSILYVSNSGIVSAFSNDGIWQYVEGIGRVYITPNGIPSAQASYLLIDKIKPNDLGVITNTITINNSVDSDFGIVLRYTGSDDTNEIEVKKDGFHIRNRLPFTMIPFGDADFFPYLFDRTKNPTVYKTIYDDNNNRVDLYIDGKYIFTSTKLHPNKNILDIFERQYGGVFVEVGALNGGWKSGFTVVNFNTVNQINNSNNSGVLSGILDPLNAIIDILQGIGTIIVWTLPEEYLPLLANIILIKTQVTALIIAFGAYIRS